MQFAYAELPCIHEAKNKQGGPNSAPHPLGMGCKVTDVRFSFNNLSAFRMRSRPAAASDKTALLRLHDVVGVGREQCGLGLGYQRQCVRSMSPS